MTCDVNSHFKSALKFLSASFRLMTSLGIHAGGVTVEEKRFTLRMDGELFEEISEYASLHRRSVAKEIELAIAKYIHDLKISEELNVYDPVTATSEEAKESLRRQVEISKKYRVFGV